MTKTVKTTYYLLGFFIWMIVSSLMIGFIPGFFSMPTYYAIIISQIVSIGIPLFIYFIIEDASPKYVFSLAPLGFIDIVLCVLLSMAISPLLSLLSFASSMFVENDVAAFIDEINKAPLWLSLIASAVCPAILEELAFRGLFFSGYTNIKLRHAALMAGIMFGLYHYSFQQFFYAAFLGVILCYVVYWTRSIFSAMLIHFCINGSQLVLSRLSAYLLSAEELAAQVPPDAQSLISSFALLGGYALISLPLLIFILWFFSKRRKKYNFETIVTEYALDYKPLEGHSERIPIIPVLLILAIYTAFIVMTQFGVS